MKREKIQRRSGSKWRVGVLEALESRVLLSGVTVIAHGYEPFSNDRPGWIDSMGEAVLARAGGGSMYALRIKSQFLGDAKVESFKKISGPDSTSAVNTTGETVLLVDWADASNVVFPFYSADKIAGLVIPYLTTAQASVGISAPLAQGSIQLIGHSRGASVVSEIARKLGNVGIWVDQLTTLDPVPVGSDPQVAFLRNTIFADNYYETNSATPGKALGGAYNVGGLDLGGAYSVADGGQHNDVFLFYHGTINTAADANNGDHNVVSSWYPNNDVNRNTTGFYYSRIGGGTKPNSGLSTLFGGSAARGALSRSGTQWGSIGRVNMTATTLLAGQSFSANYYYQSVDGAPALAWYLDPDTNPYNGNEISTGSPVLLASTGESVASQNAAITAPSRAGTYYLFGKIHKGSLERIAYAARTLTIVDPAPIGVVDGASRVGVFGWALDRDTPAQSINVRVDIDGVFYSVTTSSTLRADVNAAYGVTGNHGFFASLPVLSPTLHRIDTYAVDSSNGAAVLIGSTTINANRVPEGYVDALTTSTLQGWVWDQDTGGTAVIRVDIDNFAPIFVWGVFSRPDVDAYTGGQHAFWMDMPQLQAGSHTVQVWSIDTTNQSLKLMESKTLVVASPEGNGLPIGYIDGVTPESAVGWIYDPDNSAASINVRVDVDGVAGAVFAADLYRADVAAYLGSGNHGFHFVMPTLGAGSHRVEVYAYDATSGQPVLVSGRFVKSAGVTGYVDFANTSVSFGWAYSFDTSVPVYVRLDVDDLVGQVGLANGARADLTPLAGDPNHAFWMRYPTISAGIHRVRMWVIDPQTFSLTLIYDNPLSFA